MNGGGGQQLGDAVLPGKGCMPTLRISRMIYVSVYPA